MSAKMSISFLCDYLGVSRSSYYRRLRGPTPRQIRKRDIHSKIGVLFSRSNASYGPTRMTKELFRSFDFKTSKNTVSKYMKEIGLQKKRKRRFKVITTNSNHQNPIAPRLFKTTETKLLKPAQVLAGDITYLRLGKSFLFLAIVMDLFTRKIVGWSISKHLGSSVVEDAMQMALNNTKNFRDKNTIFLSDRGVQYSSRSFRKILCKNNILQSMSRKGNCYDNAHVESWFKSLKYEWIKNSEYQTESQLRSLVFEYIELWYNKKRLHSSIGFLPPVEYESHWLNALN